MSLRISIMDHSRRIVTLSRWHLKPETWELLDQRNGDLVHRFPIAVMPASFGVFLNVDDARVLFDPDSGVPEDLIEALDTAYRHGMTWVLFMDDDGDNLVCELTSYTEEGEIEQLGEG